MTSNDSSDWCLSYRWCYCITMAILVHPVSLAWAWVCWGLSMCLLSFADCETCTISVFFGFDQPIFFFQSMQQTLPFSRAQSCKTMKTTSAFSSWGYSQPLGVQHSTRPGPPSPGSLGMVVRVCGMFGDSVTTCNSARGYSNVTDTRLRVTLMIRRYVKIL